MSLTAMDASVDIVELDFLLFRVFLFQFLQAVLLHLASELVTVDLGLVSWRLAENTCEHAFLKITNFLLVFDYFLTLSSIYFLHLLENLLLVIFKTRTTLQILISIVAIKHSFAFGKGLNLITITLILLH
jgi:hypothetical protein